MLSYSLKKEEDISFGKEEELLEKSHQMTFSLIQIINGAMIMMYHAWMLQQLILQFLILLLKTF